MQMKSTLDDAVSGMILSASGWRGIFAGNSNEEFSGPNISEAHKIIVAAAAKVFSDYLSKVKPEAGAVIVGRDTRPTGAAIADAVMQTFFALGRDVRYLGIAAAPEIMAYARSSGSNPYRTVGEPSAAVPTAGFIYISASHNPIGHNGIKFGLTDGGVLKGEETALLVSDFRALVATPDEIEKIRRLLDRTTGAKLDEAHAASVIYKKAAYESYRDFSAEVISGYRDKPGQERFFNAIRSGLKKRPLGIAADFNGSARTVSIDREFFESLDVSFCAINDSPGKIAHRIVPEGESLDTCRLLIEELHRKDPSWLLGYMPDCDGDRGNLVIWDENEKRARPLEAQEVFALACMAELSSLVWTGELKYDGGGKALTKTAIAVNDPTSLRIDAIARFFDVPVFRAEVGEANVVNLARKLREDGYLVRILGEGSAGGTITHPSAVRDPIDTLGAILKLLAIRGNSADENSAGGDSEDRGLFEIWCDHSNQAGRYRENFTLADIIASLPAFVSTGTYTEDAILKVKTADHSLLKDRYQKIFLQEWEEKKDILKTEYAITGWEAIANNGLVEKRNLSRFGDAGKGGLKIQFSGDGAGGKETAGQAIAYIWMRGSGTEPVFRVMADAPDEGGKGQRLERMLIEWQRRMVMEADND